MNDTRLLTDLQKKIALWLFDIGAFLTKSDSETSLGFMSKFHRTHPKVPPLPCYLNLRTKNSKKPGPLEPSCIALLGSEFFLRSTILGLTYDDLIAGIPRAGDVFARSFVQEAAVHKRHVSQIFLEKDSADRIVGIRSGKYKPGQKVLLMDDVTAHGHSKREPIGVLENAGLVAWDCMVFATYDIGDSFLEKAGYRIHAAFTIEQLVKLYVEESRITPDTAEDILTTLEKTRPIYEEILEREWAN